MNRTLIILTQAAVSAVALTFAPAACAQTPGPEATAAAAAEMRTQWVIHPSLGLDAIVFLGALSGDQMASHYYAEEAADFRARFTEEENAGLDQLGAMARETGTLVGPFLALVFSVQPTDTLDDVIASAQDPETRLRPGFEQTQYWREDRWPNISAGVQGPVLAALQALQREGFEEFWRTQMEEQGIEETVARFQTELGPHDVIAEQERLLGRPLEDEIELILLNFSMPYGIRITGQRFISHISYDPDTQLRIAAHEIFHPSFDRQDEALLESLAPLRDDPWMVSIVEDHDPSFGYNSFLGVLGEGSAQALDQIVSERMGFARDPHRRWVEHDGGMHMLAAALYRAMLDDGFDETGGRYEDWLRAAIARGVLAPDNVRRLAAEVVGEDAVNAWGPHRSASASASAHPAPSHD